MDRRHFMTIGGLVAAAPLLAGAAESITTPRATAATPRDAAPVPFSRVDFGHDGLALDPAEYAAVLAEVIGSRGITADNYSNGGLIAEIEQAFAARLGKQAAMFVPTGTLANQLALRMLAGNDRRVLVQADSHIACDSGDAATTLSGLNLVPLAAGGTALELAEVQRAVELAAGGRVPMKVGVIAIENPIRRRDHTMVDAVELERICRYAREQGIRLHLDGARLFNLPQHSGRTVREHAALFDTVYVSLWKHFNGAAGAILAGDAAFIDGLFHVRRMFGGSLPQAWPQVAPVLRYLDDYEAQYARAWQTAEVLLERLRADGRFAISRLPNGTCRFMLRVPGHDAGALKAGLAAHGVRIPGAMADGTIVMQVNASLLRMPPERLAQLFVDALG